MTISHHPHVATLMCCSAGSQPEAFAAVISSHLALCPACRAEVGRMQRIGVALFDALDAAPMTGGPPVATLRAGEADTDAAPESEGPLPAAPGDVPRPLVPVLGTSLDDVHWRRAAPGLWVAPVPLSEGAHGTLLLLKVAPGAALPQHGHGGQELTLVLRGSFTDELGTFAVGDVADLDSEVEHRPLACPEQGCICLVATDGRLQFKGVLARLLQPLLGV